jgi:hypothetical protein
MRESCQWRRFLAPEHVRHLKKPAVDTGVFLRGIVIRNVVVSVFHANRFVQGSQENSLSRRGLDSAKA